MELQIIFFNRVVLSLIELYNSSVVLQFFNEYCKKSCSSFGEKNRMRKELWANNIVLRILV